MSSNELETKKEPYEQTSEEKAAIHRVAKRLEGKSIAPHFTITTCEETGVVTAGYDHEDGVVAQAMLMDNFGTADYGFFHGLSNQLLNVGERGQEGSASASNFVAGVIRSIEPKDEIEAMLAAQMAVVHQSTMLMARCLTRADTITQQDSAERAFNKLARTYTTQMQTLKRYRANAQQTVRVERVTVNEGGQAIVGNVEQGGGHETKI